MKYGLIGERLGHSFSKDIHERLGYDYELCEISPDKLESFMLARDFSGINVTIPYKREVIPYLDWIDEPASQIARAAFLLAISLAPREVSRALAVLEVAPLPRIATFLLSGSIPTWSKSAFIP